MLRLILSILAGLFTSAILASAMDHVFHTTGVYPPYGEVYYDTDLFILATAYRAVFAILGAYITAVLAKSKARKAVLTLGVIGLILSIVGLIVMWGNGPAWYPILLAITAIPLSLTGLRLYERRQQRAVIG